MNVPKIYFFGVPRIQDSNLINNRWKLFVSKLTNFTNWLFPNDIFLSRKQMSSINCLQSHSKCLMGFSKEMLTLGTKYMKDMTKQFCGIDEQRQSMQIRLISIRKLISNLIFQFLCIIINASVMIWIEENLFTNALIVLCWCWNKFATDFHLMTNILHFVVHSIRSAVVFFMPSKKSAMMLQVIFEKKP